MSVMLAALAVGFTKHPDNRPKLTVTSGTTNKGIGCFIPSDLGDPRIVISDNVYNLLSGII